MEKFNAVVTDKWFAVKDDEEGAGMVEYGLLVVLIALVAIVAVRATGTSVSGVFDDVASELSN